MEYSYDEWAFSWLTPDGSIVGKDDCIGEELVLVAELERRRRMCWANIVVALALLDPSVNVHSVVNHRWKPESFKNAFR